MKGGGDLIKLYIPKCRSINFSPWRQLFSQYKQINLESLNKIYIFPSKSFLNSIQKQGMKGGEKKMEGGWKEESGREWKEVSRRGVKKESRRGRMEGKGKWMGVGKTKV